MTTSYRTLDPEAYHNQLVPYQFMNDTLVQKSKVFRNVKATQRAITRGSKEPFDLQ